MATSYKHLRCPGCDGTLKYVKEKRFGNVFIAEMKYGEKKSMTVYIRSKML